MSDPFGDRPFPRGALLGALALVGFALLAVVAARLAGFGETRMPAASPVEARALHFHDRSDGAVAVRDAGSGRLVALLAPGTNGFVRGVMRGLARGRRLQGAGPEAPFRLTRWSDGRLSLEDAQTGRRIELDAFGPTNAGAFARLLGHAPDTGHPIDLAVKE